MPEYKINGEKQNIPNYQIAAVKHINRNRGRALIADDMGLGKTVEALLWLRLSKNRDKTPILIICPHSVKINWQREAVKWGRPSYTIEILQGRKPYPIQGDFIIINYDILHSWLPMLLRCHFSVIISDEGQYVKNYKARRTKAFNILAKSVPHLIVLTGTPIENKPIDIYNIIHAIKPSLFPNRMHFALRYCNAKRTRFGWQMDGVSRSKELHTILTKTIMIRRKKEDVLTELPPKRICKIVLDIDNVKEYRRAEEEFLRFIADKFEQDLRELNKKLREEAREFSKYKHIKVDPTLSELEIRKLKLEKVERAASAPTLVKIELLKQMAVQGKMKQIIEWITDFLESGEKLVVFATHRKVITELMEKFPHAVKIDGSVRGTKRQKAVDDFQNNPNVRLLIGNIKAAGVGITLTAASNAAMIQFPWNPGDLSQAADRIHRITQTKQVTIWHLVGKDTIEENIIDLLQKKQKVISQIIDGKESTESTVLVDLLKMYIKKSGVKRKYKAGDIIDL